MPAVKKSSIYKNLLTAYHGRKNRRLFIESIICGHRCCYPFHETLPHPDADTGLLPFEVKHRLEKYGPNSVTMKKQKRLLMRFLLQAHQPLMEKTKNFNIFYYSDGG